MTYDDNFFSKRRIQLNLFLKYITDNEELKSTKEFIKFIKDPNFDYDYFSEDISFSHLRDYPESLKNHDSISNKISDFFKNTFKKGESFELNNSNNNEKDFWNKKEFYENALKEFIALRNFVVLNNNKKNF